MGTPQNVVQSIEGRHYAGIFVLALGTLLLELALTRVLSVTLWYHFGFLVISTALLGFGSSGVLLCVWHRVRVEAPLDRTLSWLALSYGVATLVSFSAIQNIPFDPFKLFADARQVLLMPLGYLLLSTPFFFSGLAIALLLTRGSRAISRLYAADLIGAAVGCATVALTMRAFGGSGCVALAASCGPLAAAIFAQRHARGLAAFGLIVASAFGVFAGIADQAIPIRITSDKSHPLRPPNALPVFTAWNIFSRIDVYELPARPEEGWPTPGLGVVIDGGSAGTGIGDLRDGVDALLDNPSLYRAPGIAFIGHSHPRVLVIGSGAGREVLEALAFGASSVTAVEVNPIINEIVTRDFRKRLGGLFERPEVHLVTDEGRSFLKRSGEKYDAIVAIQTISNSAITSGALGLTESYMFTREAFEDFFDHLTPDGKLLVTRPATQLARFAATVREVFERRGIANPAGHLFAFRSALAPFGPRHTHDGLLVKRSPFTAAELTMIREHLETRSAGLSKFGPPEILYTPFDIHPESLIHAALAVPDLSRFYREQELDLRPSTDDWPFFNSQVQWSSLGPRSVLDAFGGGGEQLKEHGVGVVILIVLIFQSTIIAAALILLPLARFARQGLHVAARWNYLVYFAGLGLGFILFEIVLLQRFSLFLGQPIYTFAVILSNLLLFTGAGSFVADRFETPTPRLATATVAGVIGILTVTVFALPRVFLAALGLPLGWRVLIAVATIAPAGFLLGMPFPTGLRLLHRVAPALVPWAWGVNGFFTVIGSILAVLLGMALGFTATSLAAVGCYAAALLSLRTRKVHADWSDHAEDQFRGREADSPALS